MSEQYLEQKRADLSKLIAKAAQIDSQIKTASRQYHAENNMTDLQWLHKAKEAKRVNGRIIQRLTLECAQIAKTIKLEKHKESLQSQKSFERQFLVNCKSMLPKELYDAIMEKTIVKGEIDVLTEGVK